jgi:hypothetical protein
VAELTQLKLYALDVSSILATHLICVIENAIQMKKSLIEV